MLSLSLSPSLCHGENDSFRSILAPPNFVLSRPFRPGRPADRADRGGPLPRGEYLCGDRAGVTKLRASWTAGEVQMIMVKPPTGDRFEEIFQ